MKISKQARRSAKHLFGCCIQDGGLDESRVRRTVEIVIKEKPRDYFGVLGHFQRLVKLEMERRTARVESAIQLSEDLQKSVRSNLTKRYGAGLNILFVTTPELLGGLRIRVGSDVYDGSLQAGLKGIQDSF